MSGLRYFYGKPTKTTAPNGQQTITEYGAGTSELTRWIKSKSQIDETNWKEAVSWYDGLGRTYKSQSVDDDGDVFVLNCYDNVGRPWKTSNPFRGLANQDCSTANGTSDIYWTTNIFDTAGRPWKVTTPDNAVVETAYGLATAGSSIGTVVTVTDQAGKVRRSVSNALGQLIRVDEPDAINQLGTVASPIQPTSYAYDTLGNLTTVTQGVQTRTFSYDSLSRLQSAVNPESGTISYTYDNNGNLVTKTDARSISTAYTYDALNRVTLRNYSDSTPDVSYFYDNLTNAKGKLTKVSSSVSATEYTAFDILGRVTSHKQTTDGQSYSTAYAYNLSGALIEETYPSGRVVKNVLDVNGDLSKVESKKNAGAFFTPYASNFVYNAAGAVTSMKLGNGRFENTVFNSRLQPIQIGLGTSAASQNLLKLNYSYGTTDNNGNVKSQTITVPTVGANTGFVATQTYTYDSLNRLTEAKEADANNQQTWKQNFGYDRFGNRTSFNEIIGSQTNNQTPQIDAANNRFTTASGFTYDLSGNVVTDNQNRSFTYDADNKQREVKDASNNIIGHYLYDGDGKRVKKVVPLTGELTIFAYDATGKTIAEYSTIVTLLGDAKVNYITTDHLGSPRIRTDRNGQVISRTDTMPFGEEILRDSYGIDNLRNRFTTYDRDGETDLDFAEARMLSNNVGRFANPDPYNIIFEKETGKDETEKSEILVRFVSNPQRWNAYIYVLNNPLVFTDSDGLTPKTINVFIGLPEVTEAGMKEWEKFKADAAKKGITVNIYTIKDKTATPDKFLESIKAADTATVFVGHSFSRDGQKVGIEFHNGGIVSQSNVNKKEKLSTADGIDIQNDLVVVFSCNFGKAFDNISSSNGAAFVSLSNGTDGKTGVDAVNNAGLRFARMVGNGSFGGLFNGTMGAQTALTDFPSNYNQGDRVMYRLLSPAKKKK